MLKLPRKALWMISVLLKVLFSAITEVPGGHGWDLSRRVRCLGRTRSRGECRRGNGGLQGEEEEAKAGQGAGKITEETLSHAVLPTTMVLWCPGFFPWLGCPVTAAALERVHPYG